MRIQLTFHADRYVRLPIDHYHLLRGVVYERLQESDATFAAALHNTGYAPAEGDTRRFKLFTFSGLRVPKTRRRLSGSELQIAPGTVTWLLSSPREDFLRHLVSGLLARAEDLRVGGAMFRLVAADGLPDPVWQDTMAFTCLTPFVAAVASDDGRDTPRYLRPGDNIGSDDATGEDALSSAVRANLLAKYRALQGREPADTRFTLRLDAEYLERAPHGGTKKVTLPGKGGSIDVVGVMAPLTISASAELIQLAYECGIGEKNSSGMGMLEVASRE